jgi:hypothetical protein
MEPGTVIEIRGIVQCVSPYDAYGALNAPARMASQAQLTIAV